MAALPVRVGNLGPVRSAPGHTPAVKQTLFKIEVLSQEHCPPVREKNFVRVGLSL